MDIFTEIVAAFGKFAWIERLRAAHQSTGDHAARAPGAEAMLHGGDLLVVPVGEERAVDSAMMADVAIEIGGAFPDADRRQMRRSQRGHMPLIHAVIGN